MDTFGSPILLRRDPVLRFSNIAEIKSIINHFEKYNDKSTIMQKATHNILPLHKLENEIKNVQQYNTDNCKSYENKNIENSPCEFSKNKSYNYNIKNGTSGFLERIFQAILYSFSYCLWASHITLAIVAIILSMFSPRLLTDKLIYPSCRLLFGTLYPVYASYKAVRTKNIKEYVKWMMYWIVFALFNCVETFTDIFFSWFPFYYEIKIIIVIWLLSPATKGSSILYRKFVHPTLCSKEQDIDEYLSKAKEQGYKQLYTLGTRGVNYATNVIMQTAIKSGGGLVQQLRKSYSLSDLTTEDNHDGHEQPNNSIDGTVPDQRLVRRTTSSRGKNPRPTSSPRVDMYFSEVDVNMGHNTRSVGGRDNNTLSHIRSSEDISTTYPPDNSNNQDSLTRTSSVSGSSRTKSKVTRSTFTSIKRPGAAEDDEVIIEEMDDVGDSSTLSEELQNRFSDFFPDAIFEKYLEFLLYHNRSIEINMNELEMIHKGYLQFKEKNNDLNLIEIENYRVNNLQNTDDTNCNFVCNDNLNSTNNTCSKIDNNIVKFLNMNSIEICNKNETINSLENLSSADDDFLLKNPINIDFEQLNSKDEKINIQNNVEHILISEDKDNINSTQNIFENINEINNLLNTEENADSILKLNSDEIKEDDCEFITPNSSPVLKQKFTKSPKYKKRHAPPPPPILKKILREMEESEVDRNDNINKFNTKVESQETTIEKNENIYNLIENHVPNLCEGSNKLEKENMLISKSKLDIGLSKLLQIPSKLNLWNKSEGSTLINQSTSNDSLSVQEINNENIQKDEVIISNSENEQDDTSIYSFKSIAITDNSTDVIEQKSSSSNLIQPEKLEIKTFSKSTEV